MLNLFSFFLIVTFACAKMFLENFFTQAFMEEGEYQDDTSKHKQIYFQQSKIFR